MDTTKPLMILDDAIPETSEVPIHPETGEVWEEKRDELLGIQALYGHEMVGGTAVLSDKMTQASRGVSFEQRPQIYKVFYCIGSAHKGCDPRETYTCHPKTWDGLSDAQRSGFEMQEATQYNSLASDAASR